MTRVGIVGHRYFSGEKVSDFVTRQTQKIFRRMRGGAPDLVAVSAIAEGADTIFAEAALANGIPLEIVRPFKVYSSDFESTSTRMRYQHLRAAARSETRLSYDQRSDRAYEAAMQWVVTRSDLLVAVWDGYPANGPGGTGQAVLRAMQLNRWWVHINVTDLSVKYHFPGMQNRFSCESPYANTVWSSD